jgi:hypothetical protein
MIAFDLSQSVYNPNFNYKPVAYQKQVTFVT